MFIYQDAEKFINDTFYEKSFDRCSSLKIADIVGEVLKNENSNREDYFQHRPGVVHASSLTKCLRGVVFEMLGEKPDNEIDARKLGVFKAGHLFEDFIIEALGDRVKHRQREYVYQYKNLTLVGRSDYTIDDNGIMRVGENKSVHAQSFHHRHREGTLIAWHNQIQLQIYLWLERELFNNEWEGVFSYVSKDDVTIVSAPIRYNPEIIEQIVKPTLDLLAEAYEKRDPNLVPVPEMVIWNKSNERFERNWLCTYCDHHEKCVSKDWSGEAMALITAKNKEASDKTKSFSIKSKEKPMISVATLSPGDIKPGEVVSIIPTPPHTIMQPFEAIDKTGVDV